MAPEALRTYLSLLSIYKFSPVSCNCQEIKARSLRLKSAAPGYPLYRTNYKILYSQNGGGGLALSLVDFIVDYVEQFQSFRVRKCCVGLLTSCEGIVSWYFNSHGNMNCPGTSSSSYQRALFNLRQTMSPSSFNSFRLHPRAHRLRTDDQTRTTILALAVESSMT